jgi:hypothetical protein
MKDSPHGKPPQFPRFRVIDTASGQIVAVVEAEDLLAAQKRFERVRFHVEFVEQRKILLYSLQPHGQDDPVRCSMFLDGYFQVLDEALRPRHFDH